MSEATGEVKLATWAPDGGFVRQLRQRRCVLFAGAGLSAAAGLPGWVELLRRVADRGGLSGMQREEFAALLAADRLLDAASLLRETAGELVFKAALQDALKNGQPTALHQALARVPWRAIVTTNFDDLIEQTLPDWPSVTHCDAPEIARLLSEDQPFVLKAHGDLARPDSIVLDRGQFARMVWGREDFQRVMSALLLTSPLVFAGYSHSDEDFDLLLLHHVSLFGLDGARRYALMQVTNAAERAQIAVLRRKGIQLLAYTTHSEVPAAFARLAGLVADAREGVPVDGAAAPSRVPGGRALRPPAVRSGDARSRVVLIPGLMGSGLTVRHANGKQRAVWLRYSELLIGGFANLDLSMPAAHAPRVIADGLIDDFYGQACEVLAASHQLLLFPYDWRLDLRATADALARFLEHDVAEGAPCHVVAHAEGGLVAQLCAAAHPDLWESRRAGSGRLVCLGTPWHGQFESLRVLLGTNAMLAKLALLDLRHDREDVRRMFASFPSIYQTLPSPLQDATWQALYQPRNYVETTVDAGLLDLSMGLHEHRAGLAPPPGLINIVGQAVSTLDAVEDPTRLGRSSRWVATQRGDGIVPHRSTLLDGVPVYYAATEHGSLLADAEVARGVVDLLAQGSTDRLATKPTRKPH